MGCSRLTNTLASLQPCWHQMDLGDVAGEPQFLTVPCEMCSGSSSRGLRGPLPFVRGHFSTAHRHRRSPASPPAVSSRAQSPSGTIPAILVPSSGTCTSHTAGCPSGSGRRRDPGQSRPAPPAVEETHMGSQKPLLKRRSGQCWSLTETPRPGGQPWSPRDTAPRGPSCRPPAAAAPTAQRFGFQSQCCAQSARVLKLSGMHAVPEVCAVPGTLAVCAACALPSVPGIYGVPGIPGVHGVLISTLVTSERTQEIE